MELLLIKNGRSEKDANLDSSLDSFLSTRGIAGVCLSFYELSKRFNFDNYKGYCSPYYRTCQTASLFNNLCKTKFKVDKNLCNFILDNKDSVYIRNHSLIFQNLNWFDFDNEFVFSVESLDEFLSRCENFYQGLQDGEKYVIVSHSSVVKVMFFLSTGQSKEQIKEEYLKKPEMFQKMTDNSFYWIVDGEPKWNEKVLKRESTTAI